MSEDVSTKIDAISSQRLTLLRYPLIVGIVFAHAYEANVGFANSSIGVVHSGWLSNFIRELVSHGLAWSAVPLFFLMSGYFFFLEFDGSLDNYGKKLKSRISTLFIPFVFWNLLTLSLLALAQSLPATQGYFSGNSAPIRSFGPYEYFSAVFGIGRPPISYQFWFIRDLMILVLLVPLLQVILRTIPGIFLGLISVLWFIDVWPIHPTRPVALVFFYLGAYLAVSKISLFRLDRHAAAIAPAYAAFLLTDALTKDHALNMYIHRITYVLGVAVALYFTKYLVNNARSKSFLLWAAGCSFFVYAVHEPLLSVSRKIAYSILMPGTDIMVLMLYFTVPIFVIAVAMVAHVVLKSLTPKLLSIVSGGR